MRLTISVSRKIGQPNYGSEGASCEITMDVAEMTVSESPESLVSEIRRAYALAEQAVGEQLAQHQVEPPRDRDRQPSQARPPSEPEPDRQPRRQPGQPAWADPCVGQTPYVNGSRTETYQKPDGSTYVIDRGTVGGKAHDGPPRDGRQLYPWAKKLEERGLRGFIRALGDMAEREGYPPRLTDWNHEETRAAVALWREMTGADEPAPARNGYTNGRGGGR